MHRYATVRVAVKTCAGCALHTLSSVKQYYYYYYYLRVIGGGVGGEEELRWLAIVVVGGGVMTNYVGNEPREIRVSLIIIIIIFPSRFSRVRHDENRRLVGKNVYAENGHLFPGKFFGGGPSLPVDSPATLTQPDWLSPRS